MLRKCYIAAAGIARGIRLSLSPPLPRKVERTLSIGCKHTWDKTGLTTIGQRVQYTQGVLFSSTAASSGVTTSTANKLSLTSELITSE